MVKHSLALRYYLTRGTGYLCCVRNSVPTFISMCLPPLFVSQLVDDLVILEITGPNDLVATLASGQKPGPRQQAIMQVSERVCVGNQGWFSHKAWCMRAVTAQKRAKVSVDVHGYTWEQL
jgi:hypothetical protein